MPLRRKDWLLFISGLLPISALAATPIDLARSPNRQLSFLTSQLLLEKTDDLGTQHRKHQQVFNGIPVWGAQFITHTGTQKQLNKKPQPSRMNGIVYADLATDLPGDAKILLSTKMAQLAQASIQRNLRLTAPAVKPPKAQGVIYIDAQNRAHYAFYLQYFFAKQRPAYLVDASNFKPFVTWDNIRTHDTVKAGGLGGNPRVSKLYYDDKPDHLPSFTVERDTALKMCYLRNRAANLKLRSNFEPVAFPCESTTQDHPDLYWNSHFDENGGGYSPSNDTYYAATLTTQMIADWFNQPLWTDAKGQAKPLLFLMHDSDANASFVEEGYIIIGDALNTNDFYPFTSIDVVAHEMGHAITAQYSDLIYYGEFGGINEAFSDMTGKAAEYYARGEIKNWNIGDIMTDPDRWLRYMDHPAKDCADAEPQEECSIENYSEWRNNPYLNVHYSSGIYNRFFYLLATSSNWDVKKAYSLLYHANQYYWTNTSNFCQAARGVVLAAENLSFDTNAVRKAFNDVGIDVETCQ